MGTDLRYGTPSWVDLGGQAAFTPKHLLTYVLSSSENRHRFQVTGRAPGEEPAAEQTQPSKLTSWELELSPGESDVVPLMRSDGRRLLLTAVESDGARVRVIVSRVSARAPKIIKLDPRPVCSPARGSDAAPAASAASGSCPACGVSDEEAAKLAHLLKLTDPHRKVIRLALGELSRRVCMHQVDADRVACELGIVSTNDLAPVLLRIISKTIEKVSPTAGE